MFYYYLCTLYRTMWLSCIWLSFFRSRYASQVSLVGFGVSYEVESFIIGNSFYKLLDALICLFQISPFNFCLFLAYQFYTCLFTYFIFAFLMLAHFTHSIVPIMMEFCLHNLVSPPIAHLNFKLMCHYI